MDSVKQPRIAMAIAAHPDDIEFMMAGTMLQLHRAGWQLHYMNIANGSCGSTTLGAAEIAAIRLSEASAAAKFLKASFHPPFVEDIVVNYETPLLRKVAAIVRAARPTILLVPALQDYMEDHANAARLAATAAFCRNMRNFVTDPPTPPVEQEMAVYHALPYGLCDTLRREVRADFFVDVSSVLADKRHALSLHRSQKDWLDRSQGIDSYLNSMEEMSAEAGRRCGRCALAEGWCRHSHLGFAPAQFDPLCQALPGLVYPAR